MSFMALRRQNGTSSAGSGLGIGAASAFISLTSHAPSTCSIATYSKRLGQPGLTQDGVGRVAAWNTDRHCEITLRQRTGPDFMAALALPNKRAAGCAQQVSRRAIELRGH